MERVVVVVSPHPDDAELGMAGTMAAMTKSGIKVVIADLTDGEPTPFGSPEIRKSEAEKASKILGVERENLGIKNREIYDTVENREKLASLYRKWKPRLIFIPLWEDAHPDHVQACMLAEAARFYAKFVKTSMPYEPHYPAKQLHYFATHHRNKVVPSFVFDISPFIEEKMSSIQAYQSQFAANPLNAAVIEKIREQSAFWGTQIGVEYGEPFVCREHVKISSSQSLFDV